MPFSFKKTFFQSGRSLVEVLAVLAIIGVLTLGSIAGLSYLFARQNANDTVGEANSRLWAIKTSPNLDLQDNVEIDIDGYGATSRRGYNVTQYYEDGNLYAEVSHVPYRICQLSKATVGDREDLILDINVDPDGNSADCQTDDVRTGNENVLVFSLPADDEDTNTTGTGGGAGNGPGNTATPGGTPGSEPPVDYCDGIDITPYDRVCIECDEVGNISFKNGIICGMHASCSDGKCECDNPIIYKKDINDICVCNDENGYTEVNGECTQDLCAGKQVNPCQQCDPATGAITDKPLNGECKVCDPATGNISMANDGLPCSKGLCSNGECKCDSANHFIDDEDGGCVCDVGYTQKGNICQRQGDTPCYGMRCSAGEWCSYDGGCKSCFDRNVYRVDNNFESCTARCSNRELLDINNNTYCGIRCKQGEGREQDLTYGYCLPLCSPNGTCNADSYCSQEGLCKPCSRSSVFLQDKENFYAQCPLSVCGRESIIGGKYLCYPCNSSLSSISRPEIERCEACPNRYYDEVSDKCKKK